MEDKALLGGWERGLEKNRTKKNAAVIIMEYTINSQNC